MASETYDFLFRARSDLKGIEQAISAVQRLQSASQRLANMPTVGLNGGREPSRRGTFGQPQTDRNGGAPGGVLSSALPMFQSLNSAIADLARSVRRSSGVQESVDRANRRAAGGSGASAGARSSVLGPTTRVITAADRSQMAAEFQARQNSTVRRAADSTVARPSSLDEAVARRSARRAEAEARESAALTRGQRLADLRAQEPTRELPKETTAARKAFAERQRLEESTAQVSARALKFRDQMMENYFRQRNIPQGEETPQQFAARIRAAKEQSTILKYEAQQRASERAIRERDNGVFDARRANAVNKDARAEDRAAQAARNQRDLDLSGLSDKAHQTYLAQQAREHTYGKADIAREYEREQSGAATLARELEHLRQVRQGEARDAANVRQNAREQSGVAGREQQQSVLAEARAQQLRDEAINRQAQREQSGVAGREQQQRALAGARAQQLRDAAIERQARREQSGVANREFQQQALAEAREQAARDAAINRQNAREQAGLGGVELARRLSRERLAGVAANREDARYLGLNRAQIDSYGRLGVQPPLSRADQSVVTEERAAAAFAQAVERFANAATKTASGANGQASVAAAAARGDQASKQVMDRFRELEAANPRQARLLAAGEQARERAQAYTASRSVLAEARANLHNARLGELQNATGPIAAIQRGAQNFYQGARGNEEVPVLSQLGQTARFSVMYGGTYMAMRAASEALRGMGQEFIGFSDSVANLGLITGNSGDSTNRFALELSGLGAQMGLASDASIKLATTVMSLYGIADQGTPTGLQRAQVEQTQQTAARLALLSSNKADPQQIAQQIVGLQRSFGLGDYSTGRLESSSLFIAKRTGKSVDDLLSASADLSTLAAQSGMSLSKLMALTGVVGTNLAQTPLATSGAFRSALSKADDPALYAKLEGRGISTEGTLDDILTRISGRYQRGDLSEAGLNQIAQLFGRGQTAQNVAVAIKNMPRIDQLASEADAQKPDAGKTSFDKLLGKGLGYQLRQLGAEFSHLGQEIAQSGLLDVLALLLIAVKATVSVLTALVGAWNELPRVVRSGVAVAGSLLLIGSAITHLGSAAGVAAGLRSLAATFTVLRAVTAASVAGNKAAIASALAQTTASKATAGAGAAGAGAAVAAGAGARVAGIGSTLLAVIGPLILPLLAASLIGGAIGMGLATVRKRDQANKSYEGAINGEATDGSAKSLRSYADRYRTAHNDIEEQQSGFGGLFLRNDASLNARSTITKNIADAADAAAKRQDQLNKLATSGGGDTRFGDFKSADDVTNKLQGMRDAGYSAAEMLAAFNASVGSLTDQLDAANQGVLKFTSQDQLNAQASRLSNSTTAAAIDSMLQKSADDLAAAKKKAETNPLQQAAGRGALEGKVSGARDPEKDEQELDRAQRQQDALSRLNMPKLNDLSNKWLTEQLTEANEDGQVTDAEIEKIKKDRAKWLTSYLAKSKAFKDLGEDKDAIIKAAVDADAKTMSEELNDLRSKTISSDQFKSQITGYKLIADAGVEDAQIAGKGSNWAGAYAKKAYYDQGDEYIQKEMQAAKDAVVKQWRAGLLSNEEAQNEVDELNRSLAAWARDKAQAAIELTAVQIDEAKAITSLQQAKLGTGNNAGKNKLQYDMLSKMLASDQLSDEQRTSLETEFENLKRQMEAYALDLAQAMDLSGLDPRDALGQAKAKLADANRRMAEQKQTGDALSIAQAQQAAKQAAYEVQQQQLAISNAAVQAAPVAGDSIGSAEAALQVAKNSLNAAMQGTAEWYNAWRSYQDALQSLGEAQRAHAQNLRLLSIDMTDPVAMAAAEVQKALADLAAADSAAEQAAAQVALKQAQNSEEAAAFNQRLSDVQTADELGRITHQQYMSYLQSEHDRLSAVANRTRQQQDQLDQVDKLMKQAADSMNAQFNLGEINLPTVYDVRRSLQTLGGGGMAGSSMSSSVVNNTITINGADATRIMAYINEMTGGSTGMASATVRRS